MRRPRWFSGGGPDPVDVLDHREDIGDLAVTLRSNPNGPVEGSRCGEHVRRLDNSVHLPVGMVAFSNVPSPSKSHSTETIRPRRVEPEFWRGTRPVGPR